MNVGQHLIVYLYHTTMKPFHTFCLVLLAAITLTGCVSVKTQHKIDPIHITMDINVKVDRALDDFFGDLDAQAQELSE